MNLPLAVLAAAAVILVGIVLLISGSLWPGTAVLWCGIGAATYALVRASSEASPGRHALARKRI